MLLRQPVHPMGRLMVALCWHVRVTMMSDCNWNAKPEVGQSSDTPRGRNRRHRHSELLSSAVVLLLTVVLIAA